MLSETGNFVEIEKFQPEYDPNEHVYAVLCRPEVAVDVIYCRNVEIAEGKKVWKILKLLALVVCKILKK